MIAFIDMAEAQERERRVRRTYRLKERTLQKLSRFAETTDIPKEELVDIAVEHLSPQVVEKIIAERHAAEIASVRKLKEGPKGEKD